MAIPDWLQRQIDLIQTREFQDAWKRSNAGFTSEAEPEGPILSPFTMLFTEVDRLEQMFSLVEVPRPIERILSNSLYDRLDHIFDCLRMAADEAERRGDIDTAAAMRKAIASGAGKKSAEVRENDLEVNKLGAIRTIHAEMRYREGDDSLLSLDQWIDRFDKRIRNRKRTSKPTMRKYLNLLGYEWKGKRT